MTEKKINLSDYNPEFIPDGSNMSFGIVVSEWNIEITDALKVGAVDTLLKHNVPSENITVEYVPGSFELALAAQWMLEHLEVDAVICLGCVIQGETRHFEFICNAVSNGIMKVSMKYNTPVIFGVLTTENLQQAKDRSGGKHGNKGVEAAYTAIRMVDLSDSLVV